MKMAKAPKNHVDKLRNWMQFNDELCKIDPTIKKEWDDFKSDWREDEDWMAIIKHCEDENGFIWEYYMDYYDRHISHIYMRIIFGYEVLVDNVCDPELDYLEYKKEIKELESKKDTKNKSEKSWLILPLFSFSKYSDGTKELDFGWLNKVWTLKW